MEIKTTDLYQAEDLYGGMPPAGEFEYELTATEGARRLRVRGFQDEGEQIVCLDKGLDVEVLVDRSEQEVLAAINRYFG